MRRSSHVAVVVIVTLAMLGAAVTPLGVAAVTSGGQQGVTSGEPELDVYLPEKEVGVGAETALEFQLQNDGTVQSGVDDSVVTTARSVVLEIEDPGPFEVTSGPTPLGTIRNGETVPATRQIAVPDDVEPGEHELTVAVSYSYTERIAHASELTRERSATETVDVTVVVPEAPRFAVTDASTDVEPGSGGDATLEFENHGTVPANDTRATITGSGGVVVDGGSAEEFLGDLEPGASTTVTVDADVPATTSHGEKPFEVVFTYDDGDGIERTSDPVIGSLAPAPEQSFVVSDLEDTLAVGYDGEITGELHNEGPRPVDDAVLVLEPMSDSLHVEDTRYALPDLKPGESAAFRYPTDVSGSADEGPRQVRFTVEYTGMGTTTLSSDPISERVVVDPRQDEFSIDGVETTVTAGESTDLVVELTNERPETLSNIDAMLYTDRPLDSEANEAFVPELAPGESTEISFDLSAADDARETTYPVELDFEYRTERGETTLSDVYQIPVEIGANDDADESRSIAPFAVTGFGALAVAGIGVSLWFRRS